MITVKTVDKIKEKTIVRKITCSGHAEGNDHTAICSGASMLMQTLALFLAKRYPYTMDAELKDGESFVSCEAEVADRAVATAFQMVEEGMASLRNRYPDQVDVV